MVSLKKEVMKPTNTSLWNTVKAAARRKFDVYPSAYANAWVSREYKKRGGKFTGSKKGGLTKWFKENWVDISRPKKGGGFHKCGRKTSKIKGYPKCVPLAKAKRMTKKQIASAVRRKRIAEALNRRKGKKPINVRT